MRRTLVSLVQIRWAHHATQFRHPVKNVRIKTCRDVEFNVAYAEASPAFRRGWVPTVLALHGSPGSHLHYSPLIDYFSERNVRVVAPNFPGFGFTPFEKKHFQSFHNTPEEKAAFVRDFLHTVGVNRIDMLVLHSSALYPALRLLPDTLDVRSVAMLNPCGHVVMNVLKPLWWTRFLVNTFRNPILNPVIRNVTDLKVSFWKDWKKSTEHTINAGQTLLNAKFEETADLARRLGRTSIPIMMAYALDDFLLDKRAYEEFAGFLGARMDDIYEFDKQGRCTHTGRIFQSAEKYIHCMKFESGRHFVMKHYPDQIHSALWSLLEYAAASDRLVAPAPAIPDPVFVDFLSEHSLLLGQERIAQ